MELEEDARYLKKKIRTGAIDVHPTQCAIVVHFEVEATILGGTGDPMLGENKQAQKIIKIKNLTSQTDIRKLSEVIAENCNMIHPSKIPELEQLLYYLQTRKVAVNAEAVDAEMDRIRKSAHFDDIDEVQEKADITELESYIDLLYEGIKTKVQGTSMILQLTRNPDNLAELIENEMLLGALSRVLREDWKKSIELCTNIIYIFFCFSSFSDFHTLLIQYKIGSMCLQVIEHELKRYEFWREELEKKKQTALGDKTEEAQKTYIKSEKKFDVAIHKQEQLLRVTVYLLLNIAEDTTIEIKMTQKNVIKMLVELLSRKSLELLIMVVSFLKRMSIYKENKDLMKELKIIGHLNKMLPHQSDILVSLVLRLVLNLSFDAELRTDIIKCGMLPKLVTLMKEEPHRVFSLCILYHISVDDKCKPLFVFTDIVPIILHILQDNEEGQLDMELMALCINLAENAKIAGLFARDQGLRLLIRQALRNKDSLMLKMIRNIIQHEAIDKKQILGSLNEIVSLVKSCPHEEITVEVIGVLAELPEIDFLQLVTQHKLVPWICNNLSSHQKVADDIVLETVRFVGNIVRNAECAQMFANAGLPNTLIQLITAKQEDDEIVLQILYVFYQMIFHKCTRELLIKESQAPAYLIDLMHDKNTMVRAMCDTTLDIISEYDEEWATKIQYEKFKWHNSQWLEMVTQGNEPEIDAYDDDYLPRDMMLAGDSTADLLYQHDHYGGEGYEGGYDSRGVFPQDSLEDYSRYMAQGEEYRDYLGGDRREEVGGYNMGRDNLDKFRGTLDNWANNG